MRFYEEGVAPRKNVDVMKEVIDKLGGAADLEDGAPEGEKSEKKKKKKDKKRKAEDEEAAAAEPASPDGEKKKKKKKKPEAA